MLTPPGLSDTAMLPEILLPVILTAPELPEALSEPVTWPFTREVVRRLSVSDMPAVVSQLQPEPPDAQGLSARLQYGAGR